MLKTLHLDNKSLANDGDKFYKLQTIIEILSINLAQIKAYQNLRTGESLMLWKERLSLKQHDPRKRRRFDIKLYVYVDCTTDIILDFIVYIGKATNYTDSPSTFRVSTKVIQSLLQLYYGQNYVVYMDNWYSSSTLFAWLHNKRWELMELLEMITQGCHVYLRKFTKMTLQRRNKKMITVRFST